MQKADGSVIIDTGMIMDGIKKGIKNWKEQFDKISQKAKSTGKVISTTLSDGFSKSVEIAKARVESLEREYDRIEAERISAKNSGDTAAEERAAKKLIAIYDKTEAAREKLRIEVEAAARKQAATETVSAEKQKNAFSKMYSAISSAAKKTGSTIGKAFSGAKTAVSKIGKGVKNLVGKMKTAGKSSGSFASRLKGIASGALFFNLISDALRKMTDYMGKTVMKSDEMRSAMARLEGAAKTAAAPIIQAVTPALVALANAAAKALSFVVRLISAISGKSIRNMTNYAKSMEQGAGAASKMAKSMAGFDEITTLQDKNSGGGGIGDIAPDFSISEAGLTANNVIEQIKAGNWYAVGEIISSKVTESLNSVNWKSVKEKASNIALNIAEGFNGIFVNSAMWTTLGTTIAEGFNTAFAFLTSFGKTIDWEGLGADIAGGINRMLYQLDVKEAGKAISDWGKGLLKSLVTAIERMDWEQIGTTVVEYVGAIDWSGLVSSLTEGIGAALAGIAALIIGIIEPVWDEVVAWWEEVAYEDGQFTMEGLLKGIGDVFVNIGNWLMENVFNPFVKGFKEVFGIHSPSREMEILGGFVSDGFIEGFSEVLEGLKGPVNGVIGMINKMLSALTTGVNSAIRAINRLSFTVPDWVPGIGGQRWGFNIQTLSTPQIPYLAKGAVIPPNAPFMAVLGDQRHGTNIEAPLETIQQAFRAEVADMVGGMMAGFEASVQVQNQILEAVLAIEIGDTTIGEAAARYSTKQSIIHGG